ncbi:electron transport complex subunit C [Oscillospiraceae bacterium]|nr:electron transport complex subunit C [Oscillospiraceae bacterium]BDF73982.1 electron transport complex subunit C [Oscillospiraceae bacterium]
MKLSFYGGVHPSEHKEESCHAAVTELKSAPVQVAIPMSMHLGAPCAPVVQVGDTVSVGQKIAEITGLGAPIHASVSGKVVAIEPRPYSGGGKSLSVVIENDFKDTPCHDLTPHPDFTKLSTDEIVEIVKQAGITGMGGAGFPTHVKISSGLGKVDTLILNGAECEPYITSDHRLMLESGERIVGGVQILMQAFGLKKATIGVEANKPDAIEHMQGLLSGKETGIEVLSLRTRYPQGAEKQLIQRVTGREVPPGGLPAHVGCAVFNISTAAAVYDAVVDGRPLTRRIVTVTGGAIASPKNLLVPFGTPISQLIEEAGGFKENPDRVLMGGPMMGIAQYDLSCVNIKGTNAILCLTKAEAAPHVADPVCLRCARCVNVCPMHLTPVNMHMFAEKRMWEEVERLNVLDCIECGSCNFICPARIPLVQSFRTAKFEIRGLQMKAKAAKEAKA